MLKVTVQNASKYTDEVLMQVQDLLSPDDPLNHVIESIFDQRGEFERKKQAKKRQNEIDSILLTQAMQAELERILGSSRGNVMNLLIENFGQEFIDDYTLEEESFTVFTHVSDSGPWGFGTIEEAQGKLKELLYWRTYEKVLRNVDEESLELIAAAMGVSREISNTYVVLDKRRSNG